MIALGLWRCPAFVLRSAVQVLLQEVSLFEFRYNPRLEVTGEVRNMVVYPVLRLKHVTRCYPGFWHVFDGISLRCLWPEMLISMITIKMRSVPSIFLKVFCTEE